MPKWKRLRTLLGIKRGGEGIHDAGRLDAQDGGYQVLRGWTNQPLGSFTMPLCLSLTMR